MSVRTETFGRLTRYDEAGSEREAVDVTTVPGVTDTSSTETVETEHKDLTPPGSLDWKHQLQQRWSEISDDPADDSDTTDDDIGGDR